VKKLFRVETSKSGKAVIRAYNNVPTSYETKENEFFNFLEAKQILISQSGQEYQDAYSEFQYNMGLEEDACPTLQFKEDSDVEQTTTA